MIKQHCDVCDGVIPNTQGYRTIHFGRGTNTDVNTGYDPLVVCKHCWQKMLEAVGEPELYKEIDYGARRSDPVDNIIKSVLPIKDVDDHNCKNCVHSDKYLGEEPCISCLDKDKWEEKQDV